MSVTFPGEIPIKMGEVEDIMCDQCIISSEINITVDHNEESYLLVPTTKLWIQNVIYSFRNQLFPALAFIASSLARSFASVQRISYLPISIQIVRVRQRGKPKLSLLKITEGAAQDEEVDLEKCDEEVPEKCVDCTVLSEPEGEPKADIIFVHGLHGGLDRTWTQGKWRQNNPKLKDVFPIRRHSTGDLYVPIKEPVNQEPSSLKRTLTRMYSKIPAKVARKSEENNVEKDEELSFVRGEEREEVDEHDREECTDDYSTCWPQDWLPIDCPGVRVIAINYTTDVLWRPWWQRRKARTDLRERSKEMIDELLRIGVGTRPIIWVGHSKGGLFIKQMILNAWDAEKENQSLWRLYDQTKGIMFYSVPHKGSSVADVTFPFFRRSIEVLEVKRNCEFVLELHRRFLEIYNENQKKPDIFSFIDTECTPMGITSIKIIAYESADPDIGVKCDVPLDHREICKPAGRDCFLYLELVKLINRTIFNIN